MRTGLKPRQQALLEWDQRTRLFRAFEATVVPGLLQTAEYARARFAEGIRRLRLPNDINAAVAARVQRQEILYRPDKRFHFVLTEAALRFRLCPSLSRRRSPDERRHRPAPSRSVTVMRRLIRPWEYRHRRAVAGVR